ncbi:hypothetical protein RA19_23675 [Leisingera sp. ANG-M1]|uniref:hypothetical protein n=1 Tax=Leisingera sp. ANG-M1 TaxID=1577895 RepID=UPI00057FAF5C|nr:hypothetical protein [Leisingera sp. ANG-M1]KIC07559.1 hypothetical protein RA19_23675 [Leisingera sp. ANG-M1]
MSLTLNVERRSIKWPPKLYRNLLACVIPKQSFRDDYGHYVDEYREKYAGGNTKKDKSKAVAWLALTFLNEFIRASLDPARAFFVQLAIAIIIASII